ncbi:hypothetical protein ACQ858_20500 [Variovorax ureilyticus]|uniref:hypothetical protein n=1 Tax=Variovorax ureilyticus TaxID=1836198 RepID=UPI003D67F1C6
MSTPYRLGRAVLAAGTAVLVACSPTFNWREVPVGDAGVIALLPCRPERATRDLPLGGGSIPVDMAGCKAGDATFAVAHARAATAEQAEVWLRARHAATRSQLAGVPVVESPAVLARAASSPAPVRLDTQGADAAHVLWFAHRRPDGGASVYQATVSGTPSSTEAVATFFEGFRIP